MKKFLYFLAGLMAVSMTSCKDDNTVFSPADDLDRMPMTMFRQNHNTNKGDDETYATKVKEGTRNTMQLYWYGVEGCAGYEIKYGLESPLTHPEGWDVPENIIETIIVGPDVLHYEIPNLDYNTNYRFAIRVLHPDGVEEHHSKWYGHGDGNQWEDYCGKKTDMRYKTPELIFPSDKDYHSFNVYLDLKYNPAIYDQADQDTIAARFEIDDEGNFVAQKLLLMADAVNPDARTPWNEHMITKEDIELGYVHIDGLDENSVYVVRLQNTNVPIACDSYYNDITQRTKGDPGAPILVKHSVATQVWVDPDDTNPDMASYQKWHDASVKFQACLLDTLINNYAVNSKLAEGQTFYLEGGKAYYFKNNTNLNKGFTLETLPADVRAGKRATVYMKGLFEDAGGCNFMFGKPLGAGDVDAGIQVEDIIFRNLDFDVPYAQNFGKLGAAGTGNYFANMYPNGRGVEFESLQFDNCTFQGFIRGFIRTQGSKVKKFHKISTTNCIFYNMGFYKNNGGGYAWYCGEMSSNQNTLFENFIFSNNTIYGSPMSNLLTHGTGSIEWDADFHYNITLENNTFINFCTPAANKIFDFRTFPGGSTVTFKRNLFVLAADENDPRKLESAGSDIRNINGDGSIYLNFGDNYSVGCRDKHYADDGIFTSGAFSIKNNSFGKFADDATRETLVVRVGSKPLKATELFNAPNYPYHMQDGIDQETDYRAPSNFFNALQMKQVDHEIWNKNIGDPRWRSADPLHFYDQNYQDVETEQPAAKRRK